ncbi:MAG: SET domain-containing protein [Acidobacteriota bacterium]
MSEYPPTITFNHERFEIRDLGDKGAGLFATRNYETGEAIYPFDYWSQPLMPMHATNHSCDANGKFDETGMLVALRNIQAGEEITFNYLHHPIPASPWFFKCECGAATCVGWVDARVESPIE